MHSLNTVEILGKEGGEWNHGGETLVSVTLYFIKIIRSRYGRILQSVIVGCWVHGIGYITHFFPTDLTFIIR